MICAAMSMSAATAFNYSSSVAEQSADGFTARLAKGAGNSDPAKFDNGVRLYASNTITIVGEGITKVELTFAKQGSKAYAALTASADGLVAGGESTSETDLKTDTWTGTTDSIVFTLGASGQRLIKRIVINRTEGEVLPDDPTIDPEPEDSTQQALDSTYMYGDTAFVVRPTENVQGAAYSFIDNNIQVTASKGAIADNYFSCHAGENITFTATQAFKGIVIKGYVKKEFSATANRGSLTYATTDDQDGLTADPVIVITDIDSTSVTINCDKQLRCYEVRVFFAANPEDSIAGGQTGGGEVFFLNYNAGSYNDYGKQPDSTYNYTLYLWDIADETKYIGLDIYTTAELAFEGVYSFDNGNLTDYSFYNYGEGEKDYYDAIDGSVAITKNDDVYTVSGYIDCNDGNTYNFTFTGDFYEEGKAKDTIIVDVTKADALDWSTDTIRSKEGEYNYMLRLATDTIYPWIRISFYTEEQGDLSGSYSYYDYNIDFEISHVQLSEKLSNYEMLYDAEFTITKNGENYHIVGWVLTMSMVLYEFDYEGEVPFVEMQGLNDTKDGVKATKVLRNGQLLIIRGEKKYNMLGTAL